MEIENHLIEKVAHQNSVSYHLLINYHDKTLQKELSHILSGCKKNDPASQKRLYDRYAPLFLSMALRYTHVYPEGEDIMVRAFCKIFSKIDTYKEEGSFEGWMKRIVVNEALMTIRKRNNLHLAVEIAEHDVPEYANAVDELQYQELLDVLDQLPVGYKTVFNLYVIEGYKHREIAELLGISINTSKSQLILAKKRLRQLIADRELKKKDNTKYNIS